MYTISLLCVPGPRLIIYFMIYTHITICTHIKKISLCIRPLATIVLHVLKHVCCFFHSLFQGASDGWSSRHRQDGREPNLTPFDSIFYLQEFFFKAYVSLVYVSKPNVKLYVSLLCVPCQSVPQSFCESVPEALALAVAQELGSKAQMWFCQPNFFRSLETHALKLKAQNFQH